jgi:pimeloyl-ACP methyl ester carboxylesterase
MPQVPRWSSIRMMGFSCVLLAVSVAGRAQTFLAPCEIPGVKGARCGTYEVWENREAKSGRRIGLNVVVLPAIKSPRQPDAVAFLAGGPGDSATRQAANLADSNIRKTRDILLVDQRGTGKSHLLACDLYSETNPQSALGSFLPIDRVRACRAALEKSSDLRMYTTVSSVDDLDEVRAALGYQRLDLVGGSYGTRAALTYLQRHPKQVRLAILEGVSPAFDLVPLRFPRYAQNALDGVFSDCRQDARCSKAFPDLPGDLRTILAQTKARQVDAEILDPQTGNPLHVSLSRSLLGEALRYLLYQPGTALYAPVLIHQAASGDYAPFAEFALASRRLFSNGGIGQGLYLSVTCTEDLPFIDPKEAESQATGTFLDVSRYLEERAACGSWARGTLPADTHQPVRAETPVLMITGAWDPVTPPSDATQAAATLPNSLSVVIPAGGHGQDGLPGAAPCIDAIENQFLEHGGRSGVDTACVKRLHHAPFPTAPVATKAVTLTTEQQLALAGHYTGKEAPPLEIVLAHGKLVARIGDDPDEIALAPVSKEQLRALGLFGVYLKFQMRNGKSAQVTLERNGAPEGTWTRAH